MAMQPSLFISHGSPMLLVQDSQLRDFFCALGEDLTASHGRPDAILIASAHWMTASPAVGGAEALARGRILSIAYYLESIQQ